MVFMDKARITEIDILESHNKTNDVDIVIDIHAIVERSIKSIEVNVILER